ncbi:MAG: hypothetical protein IT474_04905 [Arenimonas sp.]|nr:hypothetical protein [Arenimonas sp.]
MEITVETADANSSVDRKARRLALHKQKAQCGHCPPHDGENRGRCPKADRYKSARKGRA